MPTSINMISFLLLSSTNRSGQLSLISVFCFDTGIDSDFDVLIRYSFLQWDLIFLLVLITKKYKSYNFIMPSRIKAFCRIYLPSDLLSREYYCSIDRLHPKTYLYPASMMLHPKVSRYLLAAM